MRCCLLILVTVLSFNAYSQDDNTGTVNGRVMDAITKKPLPLATITVFTMDTTVIKFRLSDDSGKFTLPKLPVNKPFRVLVTYAGYSVYRKVVELNNAQHTLNIDAVLQPDANALQAIEVSAERPPINIRKDTIEFNASAFKTLPTAFVEDLLKKLPGVEVDAAGNITVNGRSVTRILVDGKEFFGGDPRMATRNLPANIIDKVQVTDDKDEAEMNPDKPKAALGQIINLKLRKAIKKGWFGKSYGGAGSDGRYEAGGIANIFKDTFQISLLGYANNLNRAAFGLDDLRSLGGFDRGGGNIEVSHAGTASVNGLTFGGNNQGITASGGAGFNLNNVFKNGLILNSQYFYGHVNTVVDQQTVQQQFFSDTTLQTTAALKRQPVINSHRFAFVLKGKIDSTLRIDFRPGLIVSDENNKENSQSFTQNGAKILNRNVSSAGETINDINYTHTLLLFKTFRKKGRTLNISNTVNIGRTNDDETDKANSVFYNPQDSSVLQQLRATHLTSNNALISAIYTDPISAKFRFRTGYNGTYYNNTDQLYSYDYNNASAKYDVPNIKLSDRVNQQLLKNTISPGINYVSQNLYVAFTLNYTHIDVSNNFQKSTDVIRQHENYLFPGLVVNANIFSFGYNVDVTPVGVSYLQPVPDNSNPLYIREGNPALKSLITHNINLSLSKFNPHKGLFVGFFVNGAIYQNAVYVSKTVNTNGAEITHPYNANGTAAFNNNFHFNKQKKFSTVLRGSLGSGYNLSYNRNYIMVNGNRSLMQTTGIAPLLNATLNWKDVIEWTLNYQHSFNKTAYNNNQFSDVAFQTNAVIAELVLRWPRHFVWEESLNYRSNTGIIGGITPDVTVVNTAVNYLFLKDNAAQLKFSVSDLFNQNLAITKYTTENYNVNTQVNVLRRYFMLTFTYNFRNLQGSKVGKVGGIERFMRF